MQDDPKKKPIQEPPTNDNPDPPLEPEVDEDEEEEEEELPVF